MRHDQSSSDYHTAHISNIYILHSYQSLLAMPLKGRDTPADRPRNELEEEEETVQTLQYSQEQIHHSDTAARPRPNGEVGDDCELGSVDEDGDEDAGRPPTKRRRVPQSVTQRSWKRRGGVVRRSWRSCPSRGSVAQVTGASYDGRAALPSISREGVTQKSCRVTATQSIIKVTEQSACFGHRGITAFTERRVTGV